MLQHDRRRLVRWQIDRPAQMRIWPKENLYNCLVRDMNFLGCRLETRIELGQKSLVKAAISFSEEFSFDVELRVVWQKKSEENRTYGMCFERIKDADKERMHQFIQNCIPRQLWQQWWHESAQTKGTDYLDDRRVFARIVAHFPAKLLRLSDGKEFTAQTQDICAKGIGVVTQEPIFKDSELELWLSLPDGGQPFYSRGRVVWSKYSPQGFRSGINLEEANLMGLSRMMRCILPQQ